MGSSLYWAIEIIFLACYLILIVTVLDLGHHVTMQPESLIISWVLSDPSSYKVRQATIHYMNVVHLGLRMSKTKWHKQVAQARSPHLAYIHSLWH